MLPLLKKSTGDKAGSGQAALAWRPDFRDLASLPDIKTVRTSFFVNTVAIGVATALLLFVVQREWSVMGTNNSLKDVEARISATEPESNLAKVAFAKFQTEEKKFNEVQAFVEDQFRLPDFMLRIGQIMPAGVSIRRIDYRGPGKDILVTGSVEGLDSSASDIASAFVKTLQSDTALSKDITSVALANLARNVEEGALNMELLFTLKPLPSVAAKGKAKK